MLLLKHSIAVVLLLISLPLFSLEVSVTTLNYYQGEAYIEIYSRILGNSVLFAAPSVSDSLETSQVEMLLVIKEGEKIILADKYMIQSPPSDAPIDFWDLKRYSLENGDYKLELTYMDKNNPADTINYAKDFVVNHAAAYSSSSDILLTKDISSDAGVYPFQKSGFFYEPLAFNLFGESDNLFAFYLELYNLQGLSEGRYYRYTIRDADTKEQVTSPAYKQIKSQEDCLIFESFSIEDLPSGNYELNFEVVDKARQVLHQNVQSFAIYHPLTDFKINMNPDASFETSFVQLMNVGEVNYGLKAIFPRVRNNMSGILNSIIWSEEIEPKKYFLYSFWSKFNAADTKALYDQYMEVAKAVDIRFTSNVGHGFETDRGYMFLKYGQPDDLVFVEDEPSAPPYEIWIYNYLEETQQTGVKFLFYNPSIVTNDYILLHSTCRGELNNPQWEAQLYSKDNFENSGNAIQRTGVGDNFNRNARRYFSDF